MHITTFYYFTKDGHLGCFQFEIDINRDAVLFFFFSVNIYAPSHENYLGYLGLKWQSHRTCTVSILVDTQTVFQQRMRFTYFTGSPTAGIVFHFGNF